MGLVHVVAKVGDDRASESLSSPRCCGTLRSFDVPSHNIQCLLLCHCSPTPCPKAPRQSSHFAELKGPNRAGSLPRKPRRFNVAVKKLS